MRDVRLGHGEKLSRKMEEAIAALISSPSISSAAIVSGLGEASLYRWLKLPAFQAAYREARRQCVQQAISQLQAACAEAVQVLRSVMNDPVVWPAVRVTAAKAVLDLALKGIELDDFGARLDALERQSNGA